MNVNISPPPGAVPWEEVRGRLTLAGVRDRTILVEAAGCRVIVVAEGDRYAELALAAARMNATIERQAGGSELLAAPTRDEGRKRYREVLGQRWFASKQD